jgi:two-component system phosphate regulon sensor histidine kinase PhoR
MKRKINLIIILMTICTALLLAIQLYWNDEVYQNNDRIFRSDANDALEESVEKLANLRRDEFAQQYKKWMADTNLIVISCSYDEKSKEMVFSLSDKDRTLKNGRPPSRIAMSDFKQRLDHITPEAKTFFINSFVKNFVYYDLRDAKVYYHTTKLGELLGKAFAEDKLDTIRLGKLYRKALANRSIKEAFQIHTFKYQFNKFDTNNPDSVGKVYFTRQFKYGFGSAIALNASFASPKVIYLQKMKWVLLSSLLLIFITLGCFIYTVKTMLSQKKLAVLKDDFVNNMTHELKTPVATISIAAEAIDNFNLDQNTKTEYLAIIRYQATNLTHLIDQILTNLVNHQAIIGLSREKLLLNELLQLVIQQYQPQFLTANMILKLNLSAQEIWVNADPIHLGNTIANLLDNALKYSNEDKQIRIDLLQQDDSAILKITNSGDEIPAAYQSKLFEPFFRVPTGNVHQVKGYGLGLSYVHDIVKQHGGRITVSCTDQLTTFTLQLPLYDS